MNWNTGITELFDLDYPIVQAPMFGVSTVEMLVSANEAGCLGSLALADLNPEQSIELIRKAKSLTNKPFAVNIFTHQIPARTAELESRYGEVKEFLMQLALKNGLDVDFPDIASIKLTPYQDQVDALVVEKCPIVSFTFGNLDAASVQKFKAVGTKLIGTCTSVEEALLLEETGVDVICVQGWEAGGHRGSFLEEELPRIGGFSLLAQIQDAVNLPLIYAGAVYNGRTVLASRELGAAGVQVGSILLGSKESALQAFEKNRLRKVKEKDIVLTRSFSGRYARGIKNTFIEEVERAGSILPYPYQNKLTAALRKAAKEQNNAEFVNIWLGQSISPYADLSTKDILMGLIKETEALGKR